MFKKIVVPLDGSPLAEQALPLATSLANTYDAELYLVQVIATYLVPPYDLSYDAGETFRDVAVREAHEYLNKTRHRLEAQVSTPVHIKVIEGVVAENILDFADFQGADLIVMATHGRSGVGRWVFGSVAERVLRAASCPVLLVRAQPEKEKAAALSEASQTE